MEDVVAALESERALENVSHDDIAERKKLVSFFSSLPPEAFGRLRELQPESGCFNGCSFCSQNAGAIKILLNSNALANLFSALKSVSLSHYPDSVRT
jgi:uncharacterized Fe-S cluster-containing radical SAM superfamily enzyme